MPGKIRLRYANLVATLALFLALGGTAIGAQALITGRDVKDGSLTGIDVRNHSLTGAEIQTGSLGSNVFSEAALANLRGATGATGQTGERGPIGPAGPAGAGVTSLTQKVSDVTNYQDLTVIATTTLPSAGDYVIFANLRAHNTGGSDDNLNCGLFLDGAGFGGGGGPVASGATTAFSVVGATTINAPKTITLSCQGGGVTTYDLAQIEIRIHNLG